MEAGEHRGEVEARAVEGVVGWVRSWGAGGGGGRGGGAGLAGGRVCDRETCSEGAVAGGGQSGGGVASRGVGVLGGWLSSQGVEAGEHRGEVEARPVEVLVAWLRSWVAVEAQRNREWSGWLDYMGFARIPAHDDLLRTCIECSPCRSDSGQCFPKSPRRLFQPSRHQARPLPRQSPRLPPHRRSPPKLLQSRRRPPHCSPRWQRLRCLAFHRPVPGQTACTWCQRNRTHQNFCHYPAIPSRWGRSACLRRLQAEIPLTGEII